MINLYILASIFGWLGASHADAGPLFVESTGEAVIRYERSFQLDLGSCEKALEQTTNKFGDSISNDDGKPYDWRCVVGTNMYYQDRDGDPVTVYPEADHTVGLENAPVTPPVRVSDSCTVSLRVVRLGYILLIESGTPSPSQQGATACLEAAFGLPGSPLLKPAVRDFDLAASAPPPNYYDSSYGDDGSFTIPPFKDVVVGPVGKVHEFTYNASYADFEKAKLTSTTPPAECEAGVGCIRGRIASVTLTPSGGPLKSDVEVASLGFSSGGGNLDSCLTGFAWDGAAGTLQWTEEKASFSAILPPIPPGVGALKKCAQEYTSFGGAPTVRVIRYGS